jgi:hypothetical protein
MDSMIFQHQLIESLRSSFHFHEDQVTSIELLKKVGNNTSDEQRLNQWVHSGDLSAINDFECEDGTTANDGNYIGYYLVHFNSIRIIVSVLESDNKQHVPHVIDYKLLQ